MSARSGLARRVAAWVAVLGMAVSCTPPAAAHPARPSHHASGDRARPVTHRASPPWRIRPSAPHGIAGFANRVSVLPGDHVTLYVSTRARRFVVAAFRMGWYRGAEGRQVWESKPARGRVQPTGVFDPAATGTIAAPWRASMTFSTARWRPGVYLLRLAAGRYGESYVPLTVRAPSASGRVVLISPVTTWQAYNLWGCCDLYQGGNGSFGSRSRAVTFDRPYLAERGAGQFIRSELSVVAEAERLRLPLDYVTDVDLDLHPGLLTGARAVVSMGHDEYWSPAMRSALERALRDGTNVAFLGANGIFRRIRFASTPLGRDRLEINYKVAAEDPLYGVDNAAVTADWPAPPDPRPESALLGDQYACDLGTHANVAGVVAAPGSWLFAGTRVTRGEALPGLVGPETDAVQLGYPTPRPIEVLLHSPARCTSGTGVAFADTTYYVARSGAGVFDAGTIAWACAITDSCATPVSPRTESVTRRVTDNLLRAFAAGPAGTRYPARDNLAALGIAAR
jgi:hypothetical protein